MNRVKKLANKYTGRLRSLKATYVINNLFQRDRLRHNKALYKKLGIKKSIYAPLGKKDLNNIDLPGPWLDNDVDIATIKAHPKFESFSQDTQEQILTFVEKGYMILKGFYTPKEVSQFNAEIDRLLDSNSIDFNYTGKKLMQAHQHSDFIRTRFYKDDQLMDIFRFVFDRDIVPFHTINFIEGSEQKAHSDSIHMSTAPEGYMIAAWVALEPTDEKNGPLFYYPGSHKLPYISCLDYDSGNGKFTIGDNSYSKYEDKIASLIEEKNLSKEYFYAEPGDVLIWHANLIHGGDPIKESGRTRKSMVGHFFAKDVLCYHEISQRPALLDIE